MNFVTPTPIQAATIPVALTGRDICGCAATGTGKTAAYMLPTLERLLYRPTDGIAVTRVVVLVPTRELGVQVYQVSRQLAQFINIDIGLAVGGLDVKVQVTSILLTLHLQKVYTKCVKPECLYNGNNTLILLNCFIAVLYTPQGQMWTSNEI